MRNSFPGALLEHLQQPVTTTCALLLLTLRDGRQFGMTSLDVPVTYLGITYSATDGLDRSLIATDTGLTVDNSEGYLLLSDLDGVTLQMVAAGELDDARWELRMVNYRDLSMGHGIIDAGDVGMVKTKDGIIWMPELVSYAMRLRQPIGTVTSRSCRAIFGSIADDQLGCGVDAEALWEPGEVTGVSTDEPKMIFADAALTITSPVPGRVRWLTGNNASANRLYQIDAYSEASGTVVLLEPLTFDIELGDTFEIRPDCAKNMAACKAYGNLINYKGSPYIPVADGLETATPNAQIVSGSGVTGSAIVEP